MGKIILKGMEFFAYHGCHSEEQIIGNKFIVDISINADTSKAEEEDDLTGTINYQTVYDLVKMEMNVKSKLIEFVASRIIDTIYDAFPSVLKVELTLYKMNPPVNGKVEKAGITLSR